MLVFGRLRFDIINDFISSRRGDDDDVVELISVDMIATQELFKYYINLLKESKVRFKSKLFFICLFERNLLFDSQVVLS